MSLGDDSDIKKQTNLLQVFKYGSYKGKLCDDVAAEVGGVVITTQNAAILALQCLTHPLVQGTNLLLQVAAQVTNIIFTLYWTPTNNIKK